MGTVKVRAPSLQIRRFVSGLTAAELAEEAPGSQRRVTVAPSPREIYDRAEHEGRRRLSMPFLEQVATGFIAGGTIVFGIVGLV